MREARTVELEKGLLSAEIYPHEVCNGDGALSCWTAVTRGLARVGQRELVLTIVREAKARDAFPREVLDYFSAVRTFAEQGRIVDEGGVSGYRAPGPFGLGSFVGLAFMNAVPVVDVPVPPDGLAGVFLTEGELAVAAFCSVTRVLYRLGKEARYFPTPYWSDPSRKSVYAVGDADRSVLSKMRPTRLLGATATLRGSELVLTLPSAAARTIADRVSSGAAVAVLPGRERSVTAALVWMPGQAEAEAIFEAGTEPTSMAASFVALVPRGEQAEDVRFIEDGFAALLSEPTATGLADALRKGSPYSIRSSRSDWELTIRMTPDSP